MTADLSSHPVPLGDVAAGTESAAQAFSVRELRYLTQFNLRADPLGPCAAMLEDALGGALPVQPNTTARSGELTVIWLGPDEWLVVAPEGRQESVEKTLRQGIGTEAGSVVDLSAHRTTLELTGARARDVLAKGCSLDLHPTVFGPGRCAQLMLAMAPVLLVPRDGEPSAYWLLVRPSFAAYVRDWLQDASLEYTFISA